jgi:hypothetical protein
MIVKIYRFLWVVLLVALIPFFLVSAVTLAMLLTGQATVDELALPFAAISAMSIATLLIMGVPILLAGLFETATIKRLIDGGYWACWAQYATEESWHTFAEKEHQREMKANAFSWAAVIMLVILFSFISGATFFITRGSADASFIPVPLGVFFLIITILVLGNPFVGRRQSTALYRRRLRAPIPNIYIGKNGLYDDDSGYQTFRGLNERLINVYYKDGSPSRVMFEIRHRGRYSSGTQTVKVRVPSDQEVEAQNIAHRFFDEGVVKR